MLVKRIARSIRLAAFIAANMRRDLAGRSLAWWQAERQSVLELRLERVAAR
jgi:hypothetical protein